MLINISNHPISTWCSEQIDAAKIWGDLIDIPFPSVSPKASKEEIRDICQDLVNSILIICPKEESAIHIMGEMTLTYALVNELKALGYTCLASTTERKVTVNENGDKVVHFDFVQFREY